MTETVLFVGGSADDGFMELWSFMDHEICRIFAIPSHIMQAMADREENKLRWKYDNPIPLLIEGYKRKEEL
jgi:hypothetical protein